MGVLDCRPLPHYHGQIKVLPVDWQTAIWPPTTATPLPAAWRARLLLLGCEGVWAPVDAYRELAGCSWSLQPAPLAG